MGGAIGDALGWPVEFEALSQIIRQYGPQGVQDLQVTAAGTAEITDDTQMTLFTAEGILRAQTKRLTQGSADTTTCVFHALQRWLLTQGYPKIEGMEWIYDGSLLERKELHALRSPGNSCLRALASGKQGSIREPINDRKGCGGVMRVAPAGLAYPPEAAFAMGADFAALTHGHPSGYLSAGALAELIARIIAGRDLESAVLETIDVLARHDQHQECTRKLELAMALAKGDAPAREAIAQIGQGWVGEEALAISVYCALKYPDDFKGALLAAVNHDGDSDSTGAITGNILGAYRGIKSIPQQWVDTVELKDVLVQVADDLLGGQLNAETDEQRYPGY